MSTERFGAHPPREPEIVELVVSPAGGSPAGGAGADSTKDTADDVIAYRQRPHAQTEPDRWRPDWLDWLIDRLSIKVIVAALVVGLAVAVTLSIDHPADPVAGPAPADQTAPTTTEESLSPSQLILAMMIEAAQSPATLSDFTVYNNARQCPLGPADGSDPAHEIALVVAQYQPTFRVRDSAKGIEQSGTCSVQVRLEDGNGATMLVTVLPPPIDVTPLVVLGNSVGSSAVDVVADVDDWRIEIGVVGQLGQLPTERDLSAISTDSRLRWSTSNPA